MIAFVDILLTALNQLTVQLVEAVPKIIIAILIWIIGKFLIGLGVGLVKKIDIKGTEIDDRVIGILTSTVSIVGRLLLVLIILDYFGIGETVVGAIASGLTITIAIALGLAFGRALEPEARALVETAKKQLSSGKARRK